MDTIVSAALEEICALGSNGISLADLWPLLQPSLTSAGLHICEVVKRAIWNGILNTPGLQFGSKDVSIMPFEEFEKSKLKIVAEKHLRDCFVGLYDNEVADPIQRRVLDKLAIARTNGITQSQLAKDLGMKGNKLFYNVRTLECKGLIVRQSTIVRTKESSIEEENGLKSTSVVNTNLIHLYRYGKNLNSHQRLEITKEETLDNLGNAEGSNSLGDGIAGGECLKKDVLINDYLPALKAVCDKLEEADGKVLVVADIKPALGYQKTQGHRAWRRTLNRLKVAGLVEEFHAEVDKKVVKCVRLLKKFDPESFQPKVFLRGNDDIKTEQSAKSGRRGHITDQLVELPIEHQMYDMIDAAGSKGVTNIEICERLGINNRKNCYSQLTEMSPRFGIRTKPYCHNRTIIYRWISGKNSQSTAFPSMNGEPSTPKIKHLVHEKSVPGSLQFDSSTSKDEVDTLGKMKGRDMEKQLCHVPCDGESGQMLACGSSVQSLVCDIGDKTVAPEVGSGGMVTESDVVPLEASRSTSLNPLKQRSGQRYPCLLTTFSAQREQKILERLQEERFILTVELHKWLDSFEKDKPTLMARKTLTRTLNKLQHDGHCKCIQVAVPVVTNCGRSRKVEVVLHPSIHTLSPEVLGQIHERVRAFDMQSRGRGMARLKNDKSFPVLTGVQRRMSRVPIDDQAARSEAMRTNGFVLAKMVRSKLLHNFLWGYLNGSSDLENALSSGKHGYDLKNPHSTCKPFALQEAIKAMPLELFLQVVGSTYKFENLVENCKRGLCLSELPLDTYKCLMDTQATGRLSWLVDILRRLKLIRLVTDGHAVEAERIPHATLSHAMELRPYIEEPISMPHASSAFSSVDLRPRVRHDFILSNREAVDEYWKTLEYSYAAAYLPAALHAFPGSAVQEVFLLRSWASARVMSADQRAQLLKCIVDDDPNKKLSFNECEKIAKDLNLTFEQVLRVYSDRKRQRLNRFQQHLQQKDQDFQPEKINNHGLGSRKRKRSSKLRSSTHLKIDGSTGKGGKEMPPISNNVVSQYVGEENQVITSSRDDDSLLQECGELGSFIFDEELETVEIEEEEKDNYDLIRNCALSRFKPARQRKFSWTAMADRELLIQYVKDRAALGARFNRTDWASLPGLPANPNVCKRRMALLNSNHKFRKALMRLCNMLGERYVEHLDKVQESENLNLGGCSEAVPHSSSEEGLVAGISKGVEKSPESSRMAKRWDDFEDPNIKEALDGVLQLIPKTKMGSRRSERLRPEKGWTNEILDSQTCDPLGEPQLISSTNIGEEVENHVGTRSKYTRRRSGCHRIPGKFLKLLNEGTHVCRKEFESLAVSNAVELLKLVFLSTSTAPEVPNLLAETLRRYSQHDLFAAFSYLRQKKFMVGGTSTQPFVLSQQFLHSISSSPFPTNTGKRATKFSSWLSEKENDLIEKEVNLTEDLQCGDIFCLLAVISSGELLISPRLPDDGIGEAEESKNLKRKTDMDELYPEEMVKRPKILHSKDIDFRREKGFPGIMVSLTRETISVEKTIELFKKDEICSSALLFDESEQSRSPNGLDTSSCFSLPNHFEGSQNLGSIAPLRGEVKESQWEAMASYGQHLISTFSSHKVSSSLCPQLVKTVYSSIHKAGDQGLRIEEVFKVSGMGGEKVAEVILDVLQVFGLIMKVNAYDNVHVVDALYRSKYLLTPASLYEGLTTVRPINSPVINDKAYSIHLSDNREGAACTSQEETGVNLSNIHRVTILNLPEEVSHSSKELPSGNESQDHMNVEIVPMEGAHDSNFCKFVSSDDPYRPILPWINGDGTTNMIVYRGLTRRILGTVMQNPGILKDDLINRIDILNPQSCRTLLEIMVLDNHLIEKKMYARSSAAPPGILQSLLKGSFKKHEPIYRCHYFANPMCTSLL